MFELMLCSMLTILPDYLYRRYVQGKRFGHEITFFSVWFELRFGTVTCLMLTVSLITMIFYFHPSTPTATMYFRTVPIISETVGRVAEVHVDYSAQVKQGDVLFRLDNSKRAGDSGDRQAQDRRGRCFDADGRGGCLKSEGQLQEAKNADQPAQDELDVKSELQRRNPGIVPQRDIEKLQVAVAGRQGSLDAATASKQSAWTQVTALIPAEKASAEAALAEAQVDLDKTLSGRHERPRGAVPAAPRRHRRSEFAARGHPDPRRRWAARAYRGIGQIEGQVMKVGMVAEATCISKPWVIIPLVVTNVQNLHRSGPVQGRRATARGAEHGASRNNSRVHGAALQRRS